MVGSAATIARPFATEAAVRAIFHQLNFLRLNQLTAIPLDHPCGETMPRFKFKQTQYTCE